MSTIPRDRRLVVGASLLAACAVLGASGDARAEGPYVGARGGASFLDDTAFDLDSILTEVENEYETGFSFSGVAGYEFDGGGLPFDYRAEAEFGYQRTEIDSRRVVALATTFDGDDAFGDASVLFGFVNGYVDVPVTSALDVYGGGGVGFGSVDVDGFGVTPTGEVLDDEAFAFGYSLTAGVGYDVTSSITLEVAYRYKSFINAEVEAADGTQSELDLSSHNVTAGLRLSF